MDDLLSSSSWVGRLLVAVKLLLEEGWQRVVSVQVSSRELAVTAEEVLVAGPRPGLIDLKKHWNECLNVAPLRLAAYHDLRQPPL